MKPPRNDGKGICSDCEQSIPNYRSNAGGVGYNSPLADELPGSIKEAMVDGFKGYEAIPRPICGACYIIAYAQKYPGEVWEKTEEMEFIHFDLARAYRLGLLTAEPVMIQPPIAANDIVAVPHARNL